MKKRFGLMILCCLAFIAQGSLHARVMAENVGVYRTEAREYTDRNSGEEREGPQMTVIFGEFTLSKNFWKINGDYGKAVSQLMIYPASHMQASNEEATERKTESDSEQYYFVGLLRDEKAGNVTFRLKDEMGGNKTEVSFSVSEALKNTPEIGEELFTNWTYSRAYTWMSITDPKDKNRIFNAMAAMPSVYSEKIQLWNRYLESSRSRDDEAMGISAFSILGGQLAIKETLQTEVIAFPVAANEDDADEELVPIVSIPGVEVSAHPYKEMLGADSEKPPQASMADYVPSDRLYVYLPDPKSVAMFIGGTEELTVRLASFLGSNFSDYAIFERYASRFGLTQKQIQEWIAGGSIEEIAFFAPDIFFRDNTDLTFIIRLKEGAITPFSIIENTSEIITIPVGNGNSYLIKRNRLLVASTHKRELQSVLALMDKQGEGSLGHSDEFRVMAKKLPQSDRTKGYVYFSDPFIRRLTGPEVKIGQLRRTVARAKLEMITTMALLYRMDYGADAESIDILKEIDYLNSKIDFSGFTLNSGCRVVSNEWGTLKQLKTLLDNRVESATEAEESAYDDYRENYSAYWSEYFDPIAVRVDENADGSIGLETFILPLIDNSIYEGLHEMFSAKVGKSLLLPEYKTTPLLQFVFWMPTKNLELEDLFYSSSAMRFFGYANEMKEQIEGTVAISFPDADPIIQTILPGGSTLDLGTLDLEMGRGNEMMYAVALSALVRPCDIAVKIKDEVVVKKALSYLCGNWGEEWYSFSGIKRGDDVWAFSIGILGAIRLEFSAKVENGWLHWSNHPWTENPIIGTKESEFAHASLEINPESLNRGLTQAISAGQENYRRAVYSSISEIYPWMVAYGVDVPEALKLQKAAFGVSTPLPKEVKIEPDSNFSFTPYGVWGYQSTPDAIPTDDNGILKNIQSIKLWMRFEDEGLRTRVKIQIQ